MSASKKPDWKQLRLNGFVAVDYPFRKIAAYPNSAGTITIVSEEFDKTNLMTIESDEILALTNVLHLVALYAAENGAIMDAEYDTHIAICKAMDNARTPK